MNLEEVIEIVKEHNGRYNFQEYPWDTRRISTTAIDHAVAAIKALYDAGKKKFSIRKTGKTLMIDAC